MYLFTTVACKLRVLLKLSTFFLGKNSDGVQNSLDIMSRVGSIGKNYLNWDYSHTKTPLLYYQ